MTSHTTDDPTFEDPTPAATERPSGRTLDLEALKALAHPLRVKILDTLSTYGEFTASGLAERLGESSGATSYHLRQLEKHNFVREVEGKGTGRERWWERVPGAVTISPSNVSDSPSGLAASRMVLREMMSSRAQTLNDFLDRGDQVLSLDWLEATMIALSNLPLTRDQTFELSGRLSAVIDEFVATYRGQKAPGARPVQIHVNVFPVLDGNELPEEESS